MGKEIEKKFLISGFPDLPLIKKCQVNQVYISVNPEIRIRKKVCGDFEDYVEAFKSKGTVEREEIETPITKEFYNEYLRFSGVTPIRKEYKIYKLECGHELEVSLVDDTFYYCEVEFSSIEELNNWKVPDELKRYIIKDVTCDPDYKMANYWNRTRLKN